jgi:hypothetical protein
MFDMILTHSFKYKNKNMFSSVALIVPHVNVNVVVSLFQAYSLKWWGGVLRDHNGNFLLSCSEGIDQFPTPKLVEGLVIRCTMIASHGHGFMTIILAALLWCNSFHLIGITPLLVLWWVISKQRATDFDTCSFKFSNRKWNVIENK